MTKVISISDDAYNELSQLKKDNSFSQVIITLTKTQKKDSLMNLAGSLDKNKWKNIKNKLSPNGRLSGFNLLATN